MRPIVVCGLSSSMVFSRIISWTARYSKEKKKVIEYTMCVFGFPEHHCFWNISHSRKNSARCYHKFTHVLMYSTRISCQILTRLEFIKYFKILKYQTSWKSIRCDPSCSRRADGQTDKKIPNSRPRLQAVDWTDAPADLNGLFLFGERRNLVSARVPSHFKRSLHSLSVCL